MRQGRWKAISPWHGLRLVQRRRRRQSVAWHSGVKIEESRTESAACFCFNICSFARTTFYWPKAIIVSLWNKEKKVFFSFWPFASFLPSSHSVRVSLLDLDSKKRKKVGKYRKGALSIKTTTLLLPSSFLLRVCTLFSLSLGRRTATTRVSECERGWRISPPSCLNATQIDSRKIERKKDPEQSKWVSEWVGSAVEGNFPRLRMCVCVYLYSSSI